MQGFIETVAILFSLVLVVSPVIGFALFSRYLKRKETAVLQDYGLIPDKEKEK